MKKLIKKILKESDFDWISNMEPIPNCGGLPQFCVYIDTDKELMEFFDIIQKFRNNNIDFRYQYGNEMDINYWLHEFDDCSGSLTISFEIIKCVGGYQKGVNLDVEPYGDFEVKLGYWCGPISITEADSLFNHTLIKEYTFFEDFDEFKNTFKFLI